MTRRYRPSSSRFDRRRGGGFTLVELMVAIMILMVALIPLGKLLMDSVVASTDIPKIAKANDLAQALLEEVSQKKWDQNADGTGYTATPSVTLGKDGTEDPANRASLNDVDDYKDFLETAYGTSTLKNGAGVPLPSEFQEFNRKVEVQWATGSAVSGGSYATVAFSSIPNAGNPAAGPSDYKWVRVTVYWTSHNNAKSVQVSSIFANYRRK